MIIFFFVQEYTYIMSLYELNLYFSYNLLTLLTLNQDSTTNHICFQEDMKSESKGIKIKLWLRYKKLLSDQLSYKPGLIVLGSTMILILNKNLKFQLASLAIYMWKEIDKLPSFLEKINI